MRKAGLLAVIGALLLVGAGCATSATESEPVDTTTTPPSSTTSTLPMEAAAEPSTTVAEPAEALPEANGIECSASLNVVRCPDIHYATDWYGDWEMTLFHPAEGEGPWPVVVVYHGITPTRAEGVARSIAEAGAVAVAPNWLASFEMPGEPGITPDMYIDGYLFDRAACAVGRAQALAGEYGGDPTRTTVVGFSGGVHPAAWAGLGIVRDSAPCDDRTERQPIGMVLGDSQLIFQHSRWDAALADPDANATSTVDRFLDPEAWDIPDGFTAYLWTTESTGESRAIEPSPEPDSWIHARDTTGTLVDDLLALGSLEDGVVGFLDSAELLAYRLDQAGHAVLSEQHPGGHSYKDEVIDRITELIAGDVNW